MMEWRYLVLSTAAFLLIAAVGVSESLKCYQCGTFLATTSVSPCYNLTRDHLKDCQHSHCSKYVGLSTVVYGCDDNCVEKRHWSWEAYCCTEDTCNGDILDNCLSALLMTFPLMVVGLNY